MLTDVGQKASNLTSQADEPSGTPGNPVVLVASHLIWDMNKFSADVSSVVVEQLKLQNMNKLDLEYIVARS